jgi:hypothetical protein
MHQKDALAVNLLHLHRQDAQGAQLYYPHPTNLQRVQVDLSVTWSGSMLGKLSG